MTSDRPGFHVRWDCHGSTWHDLLGPRRRARRRYADLLTEIGGDGGTAWWISPDVDREAVAVGYLMLDTIAPAGPADRDRTALAALSALTAISDSYAATEQYDDIFGRHLFGRTTDEWLAAAGRGVGVWENDGMRDALRVQYETLLGQRREHGTAVVTEQVRRNRIDYREYLRWRDAEGCFSGILLFAAVAAGVDLRRLPAERIAQTLEAGIVAFDLHSMIRHRREDETGDLLRYLPGSHRQQVDAALELVRELHRDLVYATDLDRGDKEFLLRYATAGTLLPYLPMRWARTTALHVAPAHWPGGEWAHVNGRFTHAVPYTSTT